MVKATGNEAVPCVAMIVADVEIETALVGIENVAEVAPPGIVTLAGTDALVLLEEIVIPTPPTAAGPDRVTVPTDLLPPMTEVGRRVNPIKAGGFVVNTELFDILPRVPVMVDVFTL